jgi:hypothetical protein
MSKLRRKLRITAADMAKLRKRLPRGFRKAVVVRLAPKGKEVSPSYVSMQFKNPADMMVIEELVHCAEEHEQNINRLAMRIRRNVVNAN